MMAKKDLCFASLLVASLAMAAPAASQEPPALTQHLTAAREAAGELYLPVQQHLCYLHSPEDEARTNERRERAKIEPTRALDNLYYVGLDEVSVWALKTSQGIVIFDSLDNSREAQSAIVDGMTRLGLDPAQIRYVIVTHGHGDHYGGAQYLKDKFGAAILASKADWRIMAAAGSSAGMPANWDKPPAHDQDLEDGQILTLGDTSIEFHLTPGHTPGTVSSLFSVWDHGQKHVLALWGGIGLPTKRDPLEAYLASLNQFERIAEQAKADIVLTNHPHADMSLEWVSQIKRGGTNPNPLIVGPEGVRRWFGVVRECVLAQEARIDAGLTPVGRQPVAR